MPLAFSSTQVVECGTAASLSNLPATTWWAWIMVTGAAAVSEVMCKNSGATVGRLFRLYNSTTVAALSIGRASATCTASALHTSFPVYGLNKRLFFAGTADTASGLPKIYMGDENTPLAEPNPYSVQTAGSGAIGDDSAGTPNFRIGNGGSALTRPFPGVIFVSGIFNRVLELDELVALQYQTRDPFFGPQVTRSRCPGLVGFWRPGAEGAVWVRDESGTGNHGVNTAVLTADTFPGGPIEDEAVLFRPSTATDTQEWRGSYPVPQRWAPQVMYGRHQ